MLNTNYKEEIEESLKLCIEKYDFHKDNAGHAKKWYYSINYCISALSGINLVVNSVFPIVRSDPLTVAITNGSFSFVILLLNKISSDFQFFSLYTAHTLASDDYLNLQKEFKNIQTDYNTDVFNSYEFEKAQTKLLNLQNKHHIQTLYECYF